MKKQTNNGLMFRKNSLVELNEQTMNTIAGGTGIFATIVVGSTSLVLTVGTPEDMTLL